MPIATGTTITIEGIGEMKKNNLRIFLSSNELGAILQNTNTGQIFENTGARATMQYYPIETIQKIQALIGEKGSTVKLVS